MHTGRQNAEIFNVKAGGTYSNNCALMQTCQNRWCVQAAVG